MHPVFAEPYKDHTGDASVDPCASGAVGTASYQYSCYNGNYDDTGGFAAPELSVDPNVTLLGGGAGAGVLGGSTSAASGIALTLAASGRTNAGGLLHPNSGSIHYAGSTYSADDALPYMYSNLCMEITRTPLLDDEEGVSLMWGECGTRFSNENDLQRFKFGYDWMVNHSKTLLDTTLMQNLRSILGCFI